MLLCPIQNSPIFVENQWLQKRPRISQTFGENPDIYKQFGMKGHNGEDIAITVGTPVFADMDGTIRVKNSGDGGYGLHIKLRNSYMAREVVLGHLSKVLVKDGDRVAMGQKIALSGDTGFSTGPHLHRGFRRLIPQSGDVFKWSVKDYDNGYYGYIDAMPYTVTWKGTLSEYTLT